MGPSVLLSIGMLVKEWKKASSVKHAKIWLPLKRITRKLALRRLRGKEKKKAMVTSSEKASIAMNPPQSVAVLAERMGICMYFPSESALHWLFPLLRLMY